MDKKEIQQARIRNYFLDAACKVIEEEGYKELTVRKVAELAGYHYSTIYNYFKDLDHLAAYAALRFFDTSSEYIRTYSEGCGNEVEQYIKAWEGFCRFSLEHPNIFRCMFIEDMGDEAREVVFSNLGDSPLFKDKREGIAKCIEKGLLPAGKAAGIEEMLLSICIGRVVMFVNKRTRQTKEEVLKGFYDSMRFILDSSK